MTPARFYAAALMIAPIAAHAQTTETRLTGLEEVPAVSTGGTGSFRAEIDEAAGTVSYELTYDGIEGDVQQAHIHFGQPAVNGGISVFLCSNLAGPPPGTPGCPTPGGTVSGTFQVGDVIGPEAQGIAPGELNELIAAIRAGAAYVNVHSSLVPTGEIRGQLPAAANAAPAAPAVMPGKPPGPGVIPGYSQ